MFWTKPYRIDHRDEALLASPDYFIATVFLGRGRYERRVAFTLAEARVAGRELATDRPAAIYAVRGDRQLHLENVEPARERLLRGYRP